MLSSRKRLISIWHVDQLVCTNWWHDTYTSYEGSYESNAANSVHWSSSSCMIQEVRQPSFFSARARNRNERCCSDKFRRQYPTRRQLAVSTPSDIRYEQRCNKWHAMKYAFSTLSLDIENPITMVRCFAIVFWSDRSAGLGTMGKSQGLEPTHLFCTHWAGDCMITDATWRNVRQCEENTGRMVILHPNYCICNQYSNIKDMISQEGTSGWRYHP